VANYAVQLSPLSEGGTARAKRGRGGFASARHGDRNRAMGSYAPARFEDEDVRDQPGRRKERIGVDLIPPPNDVNSRCVRRGCRLIDRQTLSIHRTSEGLISCRQCACARMAVELKGVVLCSADRSDSAWPASM
jgi:hypothetical protein